MIGASAGLPSIASRPVAQLAEQRSPKPQVGGSIPSWPAIYTTAFLGYLPRMLLYKWQDDLDKS